VRWWAPLALVLALLPSLAAAAPDFAALDIHHYERPRPAPVFALPDLDGREVRLADLQGKVVLLFYWATW
jgi:cytochrome oxidase Cu insertion factor (SCO1/SenC/PrrC family)